MGAVNPVFLEFLVIYGPCLMELLQNLTLPSCFMFHKSLIWPLVNHIIPKSLGTLRDQVTYPHSKEDAIKKGYNDDKILELLRDVRLEYLVSREGGWDAVADWADVLR
jgi:hypothetical protein